ncbi:MAG: cell division protein SepF, partial [Bifidobacterium adolescentis]|nr:cell division protein SepF [Bifidobacterium adolescentis]
MAGFMKNAMSYLGMSDVAEDDDFDDEGVDAGKTSFDSDHSVTPMPSSSTTVSAASAPREQSNPFQGGRVS